MTKTMMEVYFALQFQGIGVHNGWGGMAVGIWSR